MNSRAIWQTLLSLFQTKSGIFLVAFFIAHLFGISTINLGIDWFDSYAAKLSHSNILVEILIGMVAATAITHGLNGLRIVLRYFKNALEIPGFLKDTKYRDSILWYVHFSTGMLILIGVILHLILACLGTGESIITAAAIQARLQNNYYFILMVLFLISVVFHAGYGTRTILVKYGLLLKYLPMIQIIILIIGLVLIALGINNLILLWTGGVT